MAIPKLTEGMVQLQKQLCMLRQRQEYSSKKEMPPHGKDELHIGGSHGGQRCLPVLGLSSWAISRKNPPKTYLVKDIEPEHPNARWQAV